MKKCFLIIALSLITNLYSNKANEYHLYFWGNYNWFSGNVKATNECFQKIFASECSPYIYKGYLPLLNRANQSQLIVKLIPKIQDYFEDDPEIQLIFAQALEDIGQEAEAHKLFIKLAQKFKNNNEIIFYSANSYFKNKEYKKALELIDNYINTSTIYYSNFAFYYLKAKIYNALNKRKEALSNLEKCLKLKPSFDRAWILWGLLNEQEKNNDQAIKGYKNYLKIAGKNNTIEKQLEILQKKTKNKKKQ